MKTIKTIYAFYKSNVKTMSLFFIIGLAWSCKKESNESVGKFGNGVFIVNEGSFGNTPGTINFYSKDSNKLIGGNLFESINNFPLGDVVQSMTIWNGKGYIVVNNAKKIEVVTISDFKSFATIGNLVKPRYFIGISNSVGYVSEWGADGKTGTVKVIDLDKDTIIKSIVTSGAAEAMTKVDNKVFVACNGGYGNKNEVQVIDIASHSIVASIVVGDAPTRMQLDKNGKLWVLCRGKYNSSYSLETASQLSLINPSTNVVEKTLIFPIQKTASILSINKENDKLYYKYGGVIYAQDINAESVNITSPIIQKNFYGLGIDPITNEIYGADAGKFSSNGWVFKYKNSGDIIDSFQTVGIGPNGFLFQ